MKKIFCLILSMIVLTVCASAAQITGYDENNRITVKGTTEANSAVTMLVRRAGLQTSEKTVVTVAQTEADENGAYEFEFSLGEDVKIEDCVITMKSGNENISDGISYVFAKRNGDIENIAFTQSDDAIELSASVSNPFCVAAFYDIGGKLISLELIENSNEHLSYPNGTAAFCIFAWKNGSLKPVVQNRKFDVGRISQCEVLFPGFTNKALTLSYDDGAASDKELIRIFNEYGLKGTFNIYNTVADSSVYDGHEVASHSKGHLNMTESGGATTDECVAAIRGGKDLVDGIFGSGSCKGFAWPYRPPVERDDYEQLLTAVKDTYSYARNVSSSGSFDLPTDWYNWSPTCKHDKMFEYLSAFIGDDSPGLKLFSMWGHSFEFNAPIGSEWTQVDGGWNAIKDFAAEIAKHNIWKATNIQIHDYTEASRRLEINDRYVYNPSTIDLYVKVNGVQRIVKSGEKITAAVYSEDSADYEILYPGFIKKALVMSYDDGNTSDERLVKIFNDNGIKGTFNVYKSASEYKTRYAGHEIQAHSSMYMGINEKTAAALSQSVASSEDCIAEIAAAKVRVESLGGDCTGFVWPYGVPDEPRKSELMPSIKDNYKWARPVSTTGKFDIPKDWYNWEATCTQNMLAADSENKLINDFLSSSDSLKLMYVWGHSYEFDSEKNAVTWEYIESFCKKLGARSDVWKSGAGQFYDYVTAARQIYCEDGVLHNPTNTDVYVKFGGKNIIVKKGE